MKSKPCLFYPCISSLHGSNPEGIRAVIVTGEGETYTHGIGYIFRKHVIASRIKNDPRESFFGRGGFRVSPRSAGLCRFDCIIHRPNDHLLYLLSCYLSCSVTARLGMHTLCVISTRGVPSFLPSFLPPPPPFFFPLLSSSSSVVTCFYFGYIGSCAFVRFLFLPSRP
jgi:hypothetical protein